MKKLINSPDRLLPESLDGFAAAHSDIVVLGSGRKFVRRRALTPGKIAVISGGGSGHEPLHTGFVGYGMLDAACPGQIFTSPTPDQVIEATRAVASEAGVLFIVKNYAGDRMNFEIAAELAQCRTATTIVDDDVAVENSSRGAGRRGVSGALVVEKIVGAAAERGAGLNDCVAISERVNAKTRSMGVALTSCTVPAIGKPTFDLGTDEMELGVGIHGEPGRKRVRLTPADSIAEELLTPILNDLPHREAAEVLLFVNGFGGTPVSELYLMYHVARSLLEQRGLHIARSLVGSFVTSLEMAGCSITVSLFDPEILGLWDHPVHTAALRW
jgi:dihydroxyacetone kinase-like protein